jgi:hypothetical protein
MSIRYLLEAASYIESTTIPAPIRGYFSGRYIWYSVDSLTSATEFKNDIRAGNFSRYDRILGYFETGHNLLTHVESILIRLHMAILHFKNKLKYEDKTISKLEHGELLYIHQLKAETYMEAIRKFETEVMKVLEAFETTFECILPTEKSVVSQYRDWNLMEYCEYRYNITRFQRFVKDVLHPLLSDQRDEEMSYCDVIPILRKEWDSIMYRYYAPDHVHDEDECEDCEICDDCRGCKECEPENTKMSDNEEEEESFIVNKNYHNSFTGEEDETHEDFEDAEEEIESNITLIEEKRPRGRPKRNVRRRV